MVARGCLRRGLEPARAHAYHGSTNLLWSAFGTQLAAMLLPSEATGGIVWARSPSTNRADAGQPALMMQWCKSWDTLTENASVRSADRAARLSSAWSSILRAYLPGCIN